MNSPLDILVCRVPINRQNRQSSYDQSDASGRVGSVNFLHQPDPHVFSVSLAVETIDADIFPLDMEPQRNQGAFGGGKVCMACFRAVQFCDKN